MKQLAIVTGITAGIGLATARALDQAGFFIYGIARNADKIAALDLPLVGSEVRDLAVDSDVNACLSDLDLTGYDRALLVNNAGSLDPIGPFDRIDLETTQKTMLLNGLAPLFVSQTFYRKLQKTPGCTGRIVQITSGAALRPFAGWTSYCASKAAMWMGTQVMAEEMDTEICQVMALSPGVVATQMQSQLREQSADDLPSVGWFREVAAAGKLAPPEAPANWLVALLAAEQAGERAFPHGESVDLFSA
ncbi:MAG: SDR family NAD(P)-dependent oxidoreductase [Myxococcales bacterium]|nr:SDR family NAD(P)-dependent oxidoreductase [Myxococcales bacterium]